MEKKNERLRWMDDVESDLKNMGVKRWRTRAWTEQNGRRL
jgi:hypothetical protein